MDIDVLIVGCGPAGSSAAKVVAEAGIGCVVLEEHPDVGLPVQCAGGISHSLLELLEAKPTADFIRGEIDGSRIIFYDEEYEIPSWTGYCIDRHSFDRYLSKKAEKAGAEILTSSKVTGVEHTREGYAVEVDSQYADTINARVLVGADGLFSFVGDATGIRKSLKEGEFVYCLQHDIPEPIVYEKKWYFIFNKGLPDGYAWIFPTSDQANVGVSTSRLSNVKTALNYLIEEYPQIEGEFAEHLHSDITGDVYGYPICGPKPLDEIIGEGIVLAGDAACITNPITGEGIEPAIHSGTSAGESIVYALEIDDVSKSMLSRYDRMWRSKVIGGVKLGKYLDDATQLRDHFYNVFNDKRIPRKEREALITQL
jgi:digeranylgeranylglycerophospholipid reductase